MAACDHQNYEEIDTLRLCSTALTKWNVLCSPLINIGHGLMDCATNCIKFYVDNIEPTKTVCCFPNIKPHVAKDMNAFLNRKKGAFLQGNM